MLLTVSKRLEFSASRRLFLPQWSEEQNLTAFGRETTARYGTGRNYVVFFTLTGSVDPVSGMLVNISEIKHRAQKILAANFDHKFLNEDHPAFKEVAPTAENVARRLFQEAVSVFEDLDATLVACQLIESPERSATYYATGEHDSNYHFDFSAARQTMSPRLSAAENMQLFGPAVSTHGHHYRVRLSFRNPNVTEAQAAAVVDSLRTELDHKFLNTDVSGLSDRPITTESLAQYIHQRAAATQPLHRVRLHERDDFFAEYWTGGDFYLGLQHALGAAHRLVVPDWSEEENKERFGKCNNPRGHGHLYVAEATVGGRYDERSGTLYDFVALREALADALAPWQNKHLDLETEEFRTRLSTGENIVQALWERLNPRLQDRLARLRLWETPNNRFTLRR